MATDKVEQQWTALCDEYHEAHAGVNAAVGAVNAAFVSIGKGLPNARNPSEAELDTLEAAEQWQADVQERMHDSIQQNT